MSQRSIITDFVMKPNSKGVFCLVDCGANIDCKAEHLLGFAKMGCEVDYRYIAKDRSRKITKTIGVYEKIYGNKTCGACIYRCNCHGDF